MPPSVPRATPTWTATWTAQLVIPTPPCPNVAEARYLDDLDAEMRSFGASMGLLSEDWVDASANPFLLFDETWVFARETDLMVLELQADQMIALSAPVSARELDGLVETTMVQAKDALRMMSTGVTQTDMAMLVKATDMMRGVSERAVWIRSDMDNFC